MPADWHARVLAAREAELRAFLAEQFAHADVILLPALPRPVPDWAQVTPGDARFELRELLGLHRYMGFVNYLGLPALVVPVATDAAGRPVSAQLLARPHHEADLFSTAARIARPLRCK
jgi:aspartyl-tRNA(Asn)/glutamyl-tRNA(Gln) amidotransferase subunit A